jgi:predicted dehydrogenase
MEKKEWRVAVVGLDHMHAGDQIALIERLPSTHLVGVWDRDSVRLNQIGTELQVSESDRFLDLADLLRDQKPDIAVVCSTTKEHEKLVAELARAGVHVLLEKPFAFELAEAKQIVQSAQEADIQVGVNWPLAWYPCHRTANRLISDGAIGHVTEVHYYNGNRGPLFHTHGKKTIDAEEARAIKDDSWWYDPKQGGGSLRDYLGYGVTLATWFRGGQMPVDVLARVYRAAGDQVDEQAVVVAGYPEALSTFQTRWGTFTDPWTHQPAPRCGFVVVGTEGTITSWDYDDHVALQTQENPEGIKVAVDVIPDHEQSGIANLVWCLSNDLPLYGPLSAETSLAGQRIIEAAVRSVEAGTTVLLEDVK